MPDAETEFDRAAQEAMICDILRKFHLATGVPIALFNDVFVLTDAAPDQKPFPYGRLLPYLCQCQEKQEPVETAADGDHLTILPVKTSHGVFGYICVVFGASHPAGYSESIRRFAEYVVGDITTNCLTVLLYQNHVDQFKRVIWNHLDMDLSVNTLCALMGVGKTKLSADFKKYAGTSIAKFILDTRMEKAQMLLTATDMPVSEVSAKVGFDDYTYFCRVFRKKVGLSPSVYRAQHKA